MTDLDYTPPKDGPRGGRRIAGRIEFDFVGITEDALSYLHDELVEVLDRCEKDEGITIKFWQSYEIVDPDE